MSVMESPIVLMGVMKQDVVIEGKLCKSMSMLQSTKLIEHTIGSGVVQL